MNRYKFGLTVVLVAFTALFVGSPQAIAQMSVIADGCMEEVAGFNLNCTANDVAIAGVAKGTDGKPVLEIIDPCEYPGDTTTFKATFEVVLNAQARHDVGIYFATDGDPDGNGAISGKCIIATAAYTPNPPWLDLDGKTRGLCSNNSKIECTTNKDCGAGNTCNFTQDLCGDIDAAHSPLYPELTITALCVDHDGDGFLNLPNCTSWRQPGSDRLCLDPLDAFPGAPSKCRCDLGFNVPVPVPPAAIEVTKDALPLSVKEPGGNVTFTVSIKNKGVDPKNNVYIDTLIDNKFGDLLDDTTKDVPAATNTCLELDKVIGGGETVRCAFVAYVAGKGGDSHTDIVEATGHDSRTEPNPVRDTDDATVSITDVMPAIEVTKTADPTSLVEPGGSVTFTVMVKNTSPADNLEITSLMDSVYGSLVEQGCALETIPVGGSYTCQFTANVTGNAGATETNTVTATGKDDEGNSVSAHNSATVTITDAPSSIELVKEANTQSVYEPGGNVTYTFTVYNRSSVDSVTIDSLTDTIYGDLNNHTINPTSTCILPQTIATGGSYSCQITKYVGGDPGKGVGQGFDFVTNVATAKGTDDDGKPVYDDDDATVTIVDVRPAASVTKTITQVVVTYTIVIYNESTAEPLYVKSLVDNKFGNLAGKGDCSAPLWIQAGGYYSCSFDETVTSSPHVNTVTATVSDNEGNSVSPAPSASATVTFSPVTP